MNRMQKKNSLKLTMKSREEHNISIRCISKILSFILLLNSFIFSLHCKLKCVFNTRLKQIRDYRATKES